MKLSILRGWMTRAWAGDAGLAVVVLVAELGPFIQWPGTGPVLTTVAAAGLMLLRRRHPVVVAVLVGALYVIAYQMPVPDAPVSAMLIALYSVGRHTAVLPSTAVATAAVVVGALVHRLSWEYDVSMTLGLSLPPALPVAAGHVVRLRKELGQRREQQAAENAVRAERRRLARELHDVIAHHVSVVNLYMGVARRTIPADPERARQALLTGEDTARQAMTELRHLLDVLRTDGEPIESQAGAGAPGLPALVEESGDAVLEISGAAVELPTAVDHTVYRLVQEALTNTRKHAAGARSTVRLAYLPGLLEVEVTDDGRPRPGGGGLGLGLAGMAERVSLCGGELRAGPAPEGGFVVHARLPLTEKM
ncbi:sensor histidine kinase [Nonomuraea rubra]|uniref:histidine kinase n=1 Tax=Nonomuraea rubra TaxID=46180 RepID=A0A7X0NP27_9ACTN|nr:histidine kinase [Nonomuraea rubra]MBB6546971.1 signal transduction histidine kinase [Nonomuraea rubra]